MRKIWRKICSLFLSIVLCLNLTACNFDFEGFLSDAVNYIDTLAKDFDDWWGETGKNIGIWWENAAEELENWLNEASKLGEDFCEVVNEKFNELSEFLLEEKDEIVDELLTKISNAIHYVNQNSIKKLPNSNKSFKYNDSFFDVEQEDCNYDEEAFVYKLIIGMFPADYTVFPASIVDSDGDVILGIAYSNKQDIYISNDNEYFCCTGFITLVNEKKLKDSDINEKLIIRPMDMSEQSDFSYVYTYRPESYMTHCVALDKYFNFGVDSAGSIVYECKDFYDNYDIIDDSLGALYSFDENEIIYSKYKSSYFTDSDFLQEVNFYNRTPEEIKKTLMDGLNNHTIDFSEINLENIFETVKNSIVNSPIIKQAGDLFASIGSVSLNDIFETDIFSPIPPSDSTELEKWLVGISCIIVVLITIIVNIFIPQLHTVVGAIAGATVEVFTEVVIQNIGLTSIDYRKVLVACVAGAIASNMGIVGDSFVGGITEAIFALIDGSTFESTFEAFFYGMISGIALGTLFTGLGNLLGNAVNRFFPKFAENASQFIGTHQVFFGNKATRKLTPNELALAGYSENGRFAKNGINANYKTQFKAQSMEFLPSLKNKSFNYIDADGVVSSKKLADGFLQITDDAPLSLKKDLVDFKTNKAVDRIPIKNGIVSFDILNAPSVKIDNPTIYRYTTKINGLQIKGNFEKADEALAKAFSLDPNSMPKIIKDYFTNNGYVIDDNFVLLSDDIAVLRKDLRFTWHEKDFTGIIQLVPTDLHSKIGHAGMISALRLAKVYSARSISLRGYISVYSRLILS